MDRDVSQARILNGLLHIIPDAQHDGDDNSWPGTGHPGCQCPSSSFPGEAACAAIHAVYGNPAKIVQVTPNSSKALQESGAVGCAEIQRLLKRFPGVPEQPGAWLIEKITARSRGFSHEKDADLFRPVSTPQIFWIHVFWSLPQSWVDFIRRDIEPAATG
jgi:hypothetical protein